MKNLVRFLFILLFPLTLSAQQKIAAQLYDLKSERKQKLYDLSVNFTPHGDEVRVQGDFRDTEGKTAVTEVGVIRNENLIRYEIVRSQTGEKGLITVESGKIKFEYEGADGKKKTADEKATGFILCSSNFAAFVKAHWEQFQKGDSVSVRYAVWDRLETVGFTLRKVGEKVLSGEKTIELQMKPTSFVIAALVDPVHFWYAESDKNLRVMKGRVPVKQMKDGKWKDLDAEVVYTEVQSSVSK
ncbi:hypothetical protein B9G69_014340 [Bdellovibrio sp. SKB1291214]|uniref:hypothetical protein n=1 Tax=Bdellovibrio sp. SKB1291214 TaxID=1732569 RepID=UPI000B51B078|nr:hypothetical protein [Bdellovibrio sp. SKB1291214]UYL08227.1 hypothetical protein B9G69_014340 [Bdellovibrio sp. SKB1291214]